MQKDLKFKLSVNHSAFGILNTLILSSFLTLSFLKKYRPVLVIGMICTVHCHLAFADDLPPAPPVVVDTLPSIVLYVSTAGNDTWSGKLPNVNPAKNDGPFATLERARDEIRAQRKAGTFKDGATVFVRGGDYERPKAFSLKAEDSGTESAPISYRAYPGEKPVLYAGQRISDFTPFRDSILQADVATQGFLGIVFKQLYFNGQRMTLARYPNIDPKRPKTGGWAFVDGQPVALGQKLDPTLKTKRNILLRSADVRTWAHPEDGEVNIYPHPNYVNSIIQIQSYDREKRTLRLNKDTSYEIWPLDRFYVRGLFEELDAPGEWFLDRRTWKIYFWPPGPIKNAIVRAPMAESIITMDKVDFVTIRGFILECCEGSAILLKKTRHCLVADNTIRNIGGRSDSSAGVQVENGEGNRIFGNDIYEVANYGIRIDGGDLSNLHSGNNIADNNYIHHIGLLNGHGSGVSIHGVGNRVASNLIHDTAREGIFGVGNDNIIEFNRIRHVNTDTEDTGGIYLCAGQEGWMRRGNVIRFNFISDVLGFGRKGKVWACPYFSSGIYLDDAVSGTIVHGNITVRTVNGGILIHGGRDNLIENNILADGQDHQMNWLGAKPGTTLEPEMETSYQIYKNNEVYAIRYPKFAALNPGTDGTMGGNQFIRNIFWFHGVKSSTYLVHNYLANQNQCDANLIWHFSDPLLVLSYMAEQGKKWEEWKATGNDQHSIYTDPLFVDPEKDDYRLKDNSPAFQLGFHPIPTDRIGLYAHPLRASWPVVEATGVREHPFTAEPVAPIPFPIYPISN